MIKKNIIIFVAGEGGHFSQFNRIFEKINYKFEQLYEHEVMLITDDNKVESNDLFKAIYVGNLRNKNGFNWHDIFYHLKRMFRFYIEMKKYDNICLISTGPGISILPSLIVRLLNGKVIHIETWSRFYSKSMTGKVMYYISNVFLVQNKTLLSVYPKAKYSGRL